MDNKISGFKSGESSSEMFEGNSTSPPPPPAPRMVPIDKCEPLKQEPDPLG